MTLLFLQKEIIMYDPTAGRFVSRDPKGLEGGDVNLYRYVGNNPIGASDPSGLDVLRDTFPPGDKKPTNRFRVASHRISLALELVYLKMRFDEEYKTLKILPGVYSQQMLYYLAQSPVVPGADRQRDRIYYNRFVWTKKGGFVDLKHFFAAAYGTDLEIKAATGAMKMAGGSHGKVAVGLQLYLKLGGRLPGAVPATGELTWRKGLEREVLQLLSLQNSAFAFEDLPSNRFGIDFRLRHYNPTKPLIRQLIDYLENELGGILPPPPDDIIEKLNRVRNFSSTPILDPNDRRLVPFGKHGGSYYAAGIPANTRDFFVIMLQFVEEERERKGK
jgi:hypothetical protein